MSLDAAPLSTALLLLALLGGIVGAVGQFLFNRHVPRVSPPGVVGVLFALGVLLYLFTQQAPTFALALTFVPTALGGLVGNILRTLGRQKP